MLIKTYIKLVGLWLNIMAIIRPSYAAKKGFDLFCTPFKVKLTDRQKEFLKTAELSTMSCDNLPDIQVYKWGNGSKKVLFVHGWQSHSFRWIKYILSLKKLDYTIYAFDGPASGYSKGKILNVPHYGEVLKEFLNQHGSMDYAVGHSLGAFTILYYLMEYDSQAFRKVVSLSCPGEANDFVDFYKDALSLSPRAERLIIEEFSSRFRDPSYYSLERFTENISVKGLYVHDRDDKEVPFHYTEVLEKNWKNANSFYTEGLGHKLRSPEVVSKVVDFLSE